jgi:hypothetical protein
MGKAPQNYVHVSSEPAVKGRTWYRRQDAKSVPKAAFDLVWAGSHPTQATLSRASKHLADGGVVAFVAKYDAKAAKSVSAAGLEVDRLHGVMMDGRDASASIDGRTLRLLADFYGKEVASWILAPASLAADCDAIYFARAKGARGKRTAEPVPEAPAARARRPRAGRVEVDGEEQAPTRRGRKAAARGRGRPPKRDSVPQRKKHGIGAFIREQLLAGVPKEKILANVHKEFAGKTKATMSDVNWNARKLRLQGHDVA